MLALEWHCRPCSGFPPRRLVKRGTAPCTKDLSVLTDDKPTQPAFTPKAEAARAERLAREAAALRENLKRRKAQGRSRAEQDKDEKK